MQYQKLYRYEQWIWFINITLLYEKNDQWNIWKHVTFHYSNFLCLENDVKTDCKWGKWTSWSQCESKCVTNPKWYRCGECIKTRQRIKETSSANGGEECSGENKEDTDCSVTENCPGR